MQNEPLVTNVLVSFVLTVLGSWLLRHGIDETGVRTIIETAVAVIAGLAAVWRVLVARSKVTPVSNPKTAAGTPLVPDPEAFSAEDTSR